MIDKKTVILNSIIKEYLTNLEPISSKYLQTRLEIKISSATIRNYLKRLVEEGRLEQPHISSGRVPSIDTLKEYWKKRIDTNKKIIIDRKELINRYAKKYKIFCEYRFFKSNRLKDVINYKDRFLILEFEKSEFILKYSKKFEIFFSEFLGVESSDLIKVCKSIGLTNLSKKIDAIEEKDIVIEELEEFLNIVSKNREWGNSYIKYFLDGVALEELKDGLYFSKIVPNGYLAYKNRVKIKEKDAKLLFIGALNRDYDGFMKNLTRG